MDKNIEEIYCNKDVGTCLYSDNLLCIERVELIGDIFRLYSKNNRIDNDFIKSLDEYKNKGAFYSLKKIDELGYSQGFLDFLYECEKSQNYLNNYSIRKGIFDKGYLDKSYNICYTKDLRPSVEMTLINKDIFVPVICLNNKLYRNLTYNSATFINKVNLKQNNLIIGLDSGYLIYLNRLRDSKVYIYEPDSAYVDFFKENILSNINSNLEIIFLESIDEKVIKRLDIDNIIIDNTFDIDINLKYFFDLKLFNYLEILNVDNLNNYFNKLKTDYRDIIMSGEEKFVQVLLENFKDFKGIDSSLLSAEIDFSEKVANYLRENNVFYTNYKKTQRDLNNNDFLLNILKNY